MVTNMTECNYNETVWNQKMDVIYTYFYLILFIPGLLLNTTALWVLLRYISKKTKAVIFMINLAIADLAHILSLPLRIYYYFTHTWPFGRGLCLFCFYLKYLNMYAAIMFLVCISMQRCLFLQKPFTARRWRRRYDLLISFVVWVVVGLSCSPFILMRSSNNSVTKQSLDSNATSAGCFKDLPMRHPPLSLTITMLVFLEACGFLIPLACMSYITSNCQAEKPNEKHTNGEKRRALRMVVGCFILFLFCFAPYHLNFALYLMVKQSIVSSCTVRRVVLQFHPVSLCMAGLSCCFNPILYYFLTAEFRMHLKRRTSSFSRLMSTSSYRE
uniref:Putative P2Y purinoceptor 10 n=1 Tax=Pundamilia nyererei TaxID=303518 RepID=A0A3B4ESJ3_9CICH